MTRFLIAAPNSGAGKTTITLAIMRILKREGIDFQPAKSGPDYIDPSFHTVAAGRPSVNLDAWAMQPTQIKNLAGPGNLIVEGAMGLFDGAGLAGHGSAAKLSNMLSLPVVLVIDAAKIAHSVAAMVKGFADFDPRITVVGVILNRVGSERHLNILHASLKNTGIPVFGHLLKSSYFSLPERHLGLVQAIENTDLNHWIDTVADALAPSLDLAALLALTDQKQYTEFRPSPPPAQYIAVARDLAFGFSYPHQLKSWYDAGATLSFFSPLANEPAPKDADYIYLPGGYPELHASVLTTSHIFKASMVRHASRGTSIYGECGGYMVLGKGIVDAKGVRHAMLGLLPLETSFQQQKLHLGYRKLTPLTSHFTGSLNGHEFHYATTLSAKGPPLFAVTDADDAALSDMGLHVGQTCGSFAHIITGH